jgi:pimeloyl-ACP methyl ester carboxylesterase
MTNNWPQLSPLTATTARRSYTPSYSGRPSSAPAKLYVHGLGCSKADFMEMASLPGLPTFPPVSADNPGCGDSPHDDNQPLNINGVVELMESFVAHLGLNRFLLVEGSI